MADDEEEYFVPLEDQRVFGAGIKRKRIQFIPSSASLSTTTTSSHTTEQKPTVTSVADAYLSIVLPKHKSPEKPTSVESQDVSTPKADAESATCEICHLPLSYDDISSTGDSKPHESSIAHQVCLQHSHPPSHLDRSHKGLKYLSSYGWDPDSRLGLGAKGEGIRVPIKGKMKNDTVGLGVNFDNKARVEKKEVMRLNAKEVRRKEAEGRKKAEKLREMFYRNDDVERYLGGSA